MANKEERKEQCVKSMEKLNIYKPYINDFKKHDYVCLFEGFAGFYTFQEEELDNKIKEIEKQYNCTVYAVTHEYTEFGELYDFLIVTKYKEEWNTLMSKDGDTYYPLAYVWNKDDDFCSEFGTIAVQSAFGGIRRIG